MVQATIFLEGGREREKEGGERQRGREGESKRGERERRGERENPAAAVLIVESLGRINIATGCVQSSRRICSTQKEQL